jgi:RimK-like ATP-grasp domain
MYLFLTVLYRKMSQNRPLWLIKLLNYEYWPWWAIYLPVLPYMLYQAWRNRSITYFTAVNPFIEMSGFFGESKTKMLDHVPDEYKPKTLFFEKNDIEKIVQSLEKQGIGFPLIAKPDIGERGTNVAKISNETELNLYLNQNPTAIIIQEYIDFEIELGLFYYRLPSQPKGQITSMTLKEFLTVTGDGHSTIEALMQQSDRARFQIAATRSRLGDGAMQEVLPKNQKRLLEPIGNHCRGTRFIDVNHKITPQLNAVFDKIATQIDGFNYGRFDLKVKTWEDLYAGQNIKIVELNGVAAEPAHIYDSDHKLLIAYQQVAKHWRIMADIALEQQQRGIRPVSFAKTWATTKQHIG